MNNYNYLACSEGLQNNRNLLCAFADIVSNVNFALCQDLSTVSHAVIIYTTIYFSCMYTQNDLTEYCRADGNCSYVEKAYNDCGFGVNNLAECNPITQGTIYTSIANYIYSICTCMHATYVYL